MSTEMLIWLIPLPPLLAFALIVLFTYKKHALSHWIAVSAAGLSWLGSMVVFFSAAGKEGLSHEPFRSFINWLPTQRNFLQIGVQIDPLSAVMVFFVAWTVLMIFIYSIGYHNYGQPKGTADHPGLPPHGAALKKHKETGGMVPSVEPMYARFFALISLFAFAMFTLVVSDNLLTLYIGWELMGFCSYFLIGFWYAKPSARDAAVKAFLTTRVGDVFMLLGLVLLYSQTGSLSYADTLANPVVIEELAKHSSGILGLSIAGLIGLLIFIGVIGKSAQFPLHVWLPDAMEGPTPVSAMIHAATMVSAGVYLAIRVFPLISAGWEPGHALTPTMVVLASIGAFTALFAATIALAQNDIKRVLAYSTISQLGYMIAALGIGAYVAATFHLVMHAFFKALLFLGSGSVIHGVEHGVYHTGEHVDPQNMFNMGGLRKKMPVTFWTFLLGGLALSGFPLVTAGFWSKDEILSYAFKGDYFIVFVVLAVAALLTAFYTARQITLTFLGEARTKASSHAVESVKVMIIPLIILAVFAVTAGWSGIPQGFPLFGGILPNWFEEFVGSMVKESAPHGAGESGSLVPLLTSLVVSLGGLALGWWVYKDVRAGMNDPLERVLGRFYPLIKNKYYIDEFYQAAFIKPAIWIADKVAYQFLDKFLIDGFLHAVAKGTWRLGVIFRNFFDIPVVNGTGDAIGKGTQGLGDVLRKMQTGKIQQYMILSLLVVILVGVLFYLYFLLGRV
ncbi:MAG TPA: NADH-quinone oxidoreductase subunit L [Anaerolineaceae bacterium]